MRRNLVQFRLWYRRPPKETSQPQSPILPPPPRGRSWSIRSESARAHQEHCCSTPKCQVVAWFRLGKGFDRLTHLVIHSERRFFDLLKWGRFLLDFYTYSFGVDAPNKPDWKKIVRSLLSLSQWAFFLHPDSYAHILRHLHLYLWIWMDDHSRHWHPPWAPP